MDDNLRYANERWDIHTERMISAAKAAVTAVTVLNSGSWIALLSQTKTLSEIPGGSDSLQSGLLYWGIGAFLGTTCWLFIYWSATAQYQHDVHREKLFPRVQLTLARVLGLACTFAALAFFVAGVFSLKGLVAG